MTAAPAPDPARWRLLESLFYQAADMNERDRVAFLDKACGDDSALRREVDSLFAYSGNTGPLLEQPVVQAAIQWAAASSGNIGPWKILAPLGDGGMGSVYVACRADEAYEQKGRRMAARRQGRVGRPSASSVSKRCCGAANLDCAPVKRARQRKPPERCCVPAAFVLKL